MSISLSNVSSRMNTNLATFEPAKIDIVDEFNANAKPNMYGVSKFNKKPSNAEITLEFNYFLESDLFPLNFIMQDRKYPKKLFLNHPGVSGQVMDFYTRTGETKITYDHQSSYFPPTSPVTAFTTTEYNKVRQIDSLYFNSKSLSVGSYNYFFIVFTFDLTAYINAYGLDSIERLTLMLHNPYCETNWNMKAGYRVHALKLRTNGVYASSFDTLLGTQEYSITDVDLRTAGKMNQQFYSLKKENAFTNIQDYIEDVNNYSLYGVNTVSFMLSNYQGGYNDLGLNYVGLAINGYGVRQTNEDNFTFANSYTGSGYTGTVVLSEV